jgi:hypothetical protein
MILKMKYDARVNMKEKDRRDIREDRKTDHQTSADLVIGFRNCGFDWTGCRNLSGGWKKEESRTGRSG